MTYEEHEERFWSKVNFLASNGCWEWCAFRNPEGYGTVSIDGKMMLAHRTSYQMLVGNIPNGLTLDHLCRNRRCVNPMHLEPVTMKVNTHRGYSFAGVNIRKTHCKNGHPLEGENLLPSALKRGKRECRICQQSRQRKRVVRRTPEQQARRTAYMKVYNKQYSQKRRAREDSNNAM